MDKHTESKAGGSSAKAPARTKSTASAKPASPVQNAERTQRPVETAPDDTRKARPSDAINTPSSQQPPNNPAAAPLRAAAGDDDTMSKQQAQAMPSTDELKGKWKQQVGAAKVAWGKLTEDELLKSEGEAQKLAGLVQERYAVSREEAEKQIKKFFDTH